MSTLFDQDKKEENQYKYHVDPDKDWMAELIGEGKKYADVKAAAKAIAEKDAFISRLQDENEGIRQDLQKRSTIEEVATLLTSKMKQSNTPSSQSNHDDEEDQSDQGKTAQPDVQKIVQEALAADRQKAAREANVSRVKESLKSAFGNNWQTEAENRAKEMGMNSQQAFEVAATNPELFLRAIVPQSNANQKEVVQKPGLFGTTKVASTLNGQTETGYKGQSYFDKIRKDDPAKYWSKAVQMELHKQATENYEKFKSN